MGLKDMSHPSKEPLDGSVSSDKYDNDFLQGMNYAFEGPS